MENAWGYSFFGRKLALKCQASKKVTKNLENISFQGFLLGGDKRDRTADLLNAIQALSQLSYTPMVLKPLTLLVSCLI